MKCQLPTANAQSLGAVNWPARHPERRGAKRNAVEGSRGVSVKVSIKQLSRGQSFKETPRDPSIALRSLRSLRFARDDEGGAL